MGCDCRVRPKIKPDFIEWNSGSINDLTYIDYCPKHNPKHVDKLVEAAKWVTKFRKCDCANAIAEPFEFCLMCQLKNALRPFMEKERG
jgi:hypothetical protein